MFSTTKLLFQAFKVFNHKLTPYVYGFESGTRLKLRIKGAFLDTFFYIISNKNVRITGQTECNCRSTVDYRDQWVAHYSACLRMVQVSMALHTMYAVHGNEGHCMTVHSRMQTGQLSAHETAPAVRLTMLLMGVNNPWLQMSSLRVYRAVPRQLNMHACFSAT